VRVARALALALAVTAVAGCGGGGDREPAGSLRWKDDPTLVRVGALPNDRILSGILRNDGRDRADLVAKKLKLLDAKGRRIPASAAFVQVYLHGINPPTREPGGREPVEEQLRTGKIARVQPGVELPLTISWRQPPGVDPPVRIDWGRGSIPVPDKPPTAVR
jgi:hypothetical protein